MSVTIEADKHRESAIKNLQAAYEDLMEMLQPDSGAHREWSHEYIDTAHQVAQEVLKLKRKL